MTKTDSKYHFVVATEKNITDFWEKTQIAIFLDKTSNRNNCTVLYENKEGLPKVYNKFISDKFSNKKVIFVHDDVLIEDLFWEEKLDLGFEKYNVVGLAGSKKCNLDSPVSAWHIMSEKQDYLGEVSHSKDKITWTTVFGPTNSRALILDGLFIAVDVQKMLETNTKFDERFDFHHYDITFCLNANKNKVKMGVIPLKATHFGLGDSMNSIAWTQSAEKFKTLYK
jgi:hypothetical protein